MQKKYGIVALIFIGIVVGYGLKDSISAFIFRPLPSSLESKRINNTGNATLADIEVIAENLTIPWELVFLPDNTMLITQRPGNLLLLTKDRAQITIEGVEHVGEGGLLGMALHPNFAVNNWIYLYLTTATETGLENRIERYVFKNAQLSDKKVIISAIPGAKYHDGGRIAFGPDGYLYVTTGDAQVESEAQNNKSFHGTILRAQDDGSVPADNPFGTLVYSYGHRNVQGLTWDDEGRLWVTEHGRSGIQSGFDELNLISPGANYGWPIVEGDETAQGMTSPVLHSGADDTWAPAGMVYTDGALFFAGLRGSALYKVPVKDGVAQPIEMYLREAYGRLRTVTIGPDGMLYVLTSNTDGRGEPQKNDDKLIRINPKAL